MTRAEIIIKSAELRLENALRAFRYQLYGDEAERHEGRLVDAMLRNDAKPAPEVRKKLKKNWAWWIRTRGRMG